ncbi:hypothetical protein Tco_0168838, partial [Tanacetum coccineum]
GEVGGDMCKQEEAVGAITALSAEFISALVLKEKKRRRAKYESYRMRLGASGRSGYSIP